MFRKEDYILMAVVAVSLSAGVFFPDYGGVLMPYTRHLMMGLLFLSFTSIELRSVRQVAGRHIKGVSRLLLLKLFLFPVAVYWLFHLVLPDYAVPALLVAGVSTGVAAPFMSDVVGANGALVLVMVVVSSVMVPFTLPPLTELLAGRALDIPVTGMFKTLAQIIFIPMLAVEILRRTRPGALRRIVRVKYHLSLVLIFGINMGVFSQFSDYFHTNPWMVATSIGVAFCLAGLALALGVTAFWTGSAEDQLAAAVSMVNINNMVVVVFASEFFGPLAPTLAAMYVIPFFAMFLPMKAYRNVIRARRGQVG